MERIADRVEAGGGVSIPEWAGVYRVVGREGFFEQAGNGWPC